jgi:hypothetical protein
MENQYTTNNDNTLQSINHNIKLTWMFTNFIEIKRTDHYLSFPHPLFAKIMANLTKIESLLLNKIVTLLSKHVLLAYYYV